MPEDHQIIRSIINVNYAGEFGAIRLYSGQLFIARLLHPGMMNIIRTIRHDEKKHCALFRDIMPNYGMRSCRMTWIWAVAGSLLGIVTPLLGRRALLVSIKAAEDTAHEHLGAQIHYLQSRDERLALTIADVQTEEQKHVSISEQELGDSRISRYESLVYNSVYKLCQATMWVVTRGASSELKRSLAV
jgi:3-demethoxyubiquinol 3-hydroxylase